MISEKREHTVKSMAMWHNDINPAVLIRRPGFSQFLPLPACVIVDKSFNLSRGYFPNMGVSGDASRTKLYHTIFNHNLKNNFIANLFLVKS